MALKDVYAKPLASLDSLGGQLAFHLGVLRAIPRSIARYPREIMRIVAEVTLGTGALAVIGGTVGVIIGMTFFTGAQVGLSGYAALNQLGTAAFAGFVSAYFNTREIAPLVAGIALAGSVGCGFTAQLGAMRIAEEVDALEVMAIPSMPFLVATRVVGGLIATRRGPHARWGSRLVGGYTVITGLGLFLTVPGTLGVEMGPVLTLTNIAWQFALLLSLIHI